VASVKNRADGRLRAAGVVRHRRVVDNARLPMPRRIDPYQDAPRLPDGEFLDLAGIFQFVGPIELEVGPGRGRFIIERLQADPEVCVVGLEIRRKWATLVDRRIARLGLGGRGRVFAEDVRGALPRFKDACLRRIYVHFPDPWWKKRHQKRMVINQWFVDEAARVLAPGGEVYVQTDVEERAEAYAKVFGVSSKWVPIAIEGDPGADEFGARSPRERRALEDGLPIHRLRFQRRAV
jgi:tRNA (guanine-N7-)-methyltransferase